MWICREAKKERMDWNRTTRPAAWPGYIAAVPIVALAVAVRVWLLGGLGTRNAFLTLYPAVIAAALCGGLPAGLLAMVLSSLCVSFWLMDPIGSFSIVNPIDWLSLAVFIVCCTMVSFLAEAVYRARLRAREAEAQAALLAERERAALAVNDSRERLHLALESGRAGTWDRDLITDKPFWDDYMHKLFGLGPGTFSGNLEDLTGMVHPDDRERVGGEIATALRGDADLATTYRVVWPDSSVHFIADRGKVYRDRFGRPVRITGISWDFTELRAAQEALRESEERLRLSLEAINDGLWDWNLPSGKAVFSPRWFTMLGYEPYEFPQTYDAWKTLLHPEDVDWTIREIKEHISRGEGYAIETRMRTKTGGWRWILTRGGVVERDAAGNPVRLVGTHSDITERKRAEEEVRENEEILEAVFRLSPVGICVRDADGNYLHVNDEYCRTFEFSKEELIGRNFSLILPPGEVEAAKATYSRFVIENLPRPRERKRRRKDGAIVYTEATDCILSREKGDVAVITVVRDISRRKRTEESLLYSEDRYRRLFEDAVLGIFRSTPDGKIISVNPAFARMFAFESPEQARDQVNDVGADLYVDPSRRHEIVRRIFDAKGPILVENRFRRKDGNLFTGNLHLWAVRDGDGKLLCLEGFVEDITERKVAEQEKEKLEARLHQAQKLEAIGTLAGGIAHDFNNILAPIIGYTEMALNDVTQSHPMRHGLEQVLSAAFRAKDLVKQILAFGRSGKEQQQRPVEIGSVVKEALELLKASLPSSIEMRQNIESGVASADATQIHQVLLNLCTNAAHAMDDKGILDIRLCRVDLSLRDMADQSITDLKPGPYLKLSVSDTGSGMDKKTLLRIFDPYFTSKEVGKGSGLGLAVVLGIVKRHDGAITVCSEPGKGTVFHVYLPRVNDEFESTVKVDNVLPGGSERILLVDDEPTVMQMGTTALERLGYKVTSSADSVIALELVQAGPCDFDLIITDFTMPKMTGLDFTREVRQILPHIPILLCTGFSEKITRRSLEELEVGLLMKPYGMKQLSETVRKVLEGAHTKNARPPS
jgi:PAS domain S-box-containing protein